MTKTEEKNDHVDKKKLFEWIRKIEDDVSHARDATNLIALRVTALEDQLREHVTNDRKWWRTTIDQVLKDLDHVRQQVGLPTSGVVTNRGPASHARPSSSPPRPADHPVDAATRTQPVSPRPG